MALEAPAAGLDRSVLWTLLAGNTLVGISIGFWLPILPLYVGARGGSSIVVGAVFAAGQLARGLVQYPAGRISDRLGRRPVIVASIAAYSLAFLLYLIPLPPFWLVAVRFIHAGVAGFYAPAAAALLADLTPVGERGAAFGRFQATNMAGFVLGPALGGLVAGIRLDAVFVAGTLICLLATLLLLRLPGRDGSAPQEGGGDAPLSPFRLLWILVPVGLLGWVMSYTIGAYDTVWSLYMTLNGANILLVGLSFTLFALPIMFLAGPAGSLSDRLGSRPTAIVCTAFYGLFAAAYAFVTNIPALLAMGIAEGVLIAGGQPAVMAEVSRRAPPGAQGSTQGLYQTMQVAAIMTGALVAGYLFSLRPAYAFGSIFAVAVVCIALSQLMWRRRV
jgi:DHA1 family multidrug resistance protein-like MFS transporter